MSSVRFHTGDKTHKAGVYDNLRCSAVSSDGGCGAKLVGPIRMSSKFLTLRDCLREVGRLIQQVCRYVRSDARAYDPTCVVAAQEFQTDVKMLLMRSRNVLVCPGHFWLLKFGKVPGRNSSVEKEFKLGTRQYEEYKGVHFGNGDCALLVDVWLHRVDEDASGLTFEEI